MILNVTVCLEMQAPDYNKSAKTLV